MSINWYLMVSAIVFSVGVGGVLSPAGGATPDEGER